MVERRDNEYKLNRGKNMFMIAGNLVSDLMVCLCGKELELLCLRVAECESNATSLEHCNSDS